MFTNIFPKFDKGRILKREMLESLRDYPKDFIDIYFHDFSNGIISGADLVIKDTEIIITKGIIKHENKMYMLQKEISIPYKAENKEVLVKVKFLDEIQKSDFNIGNTEIFIDGNTNIEKNEIELGRFELKEGAILRDDYKDFKDFSTEYNTVNIINVEYAGIEKSIMHPKILRYFSSVLLKNKTDNAYDIAFVMECMNENIKDRELIIYYISNRLNISYKDYSNMQLYKYLCQIIREVESGVKKVEGRHNRHSRIIVD